MFRFCCCCSNFAAAKVVAALIIITIISNAVSAGIITYFQSIGMLDVMDWVVLAWLLLLVSILATACIITGLARRSPKLLYCYAFWHTAQMILMVVFLALIITGLDGVIPDGGPVIACWIGVAVIAVLYLWMIATGLGASQEIRYMNDSFGRYSQNQRTVVYNVRN